MLVKHTTVKVMRTGKKRDAGMLGAEMFQKDDVLLLPWAIIRYVILL